MHRPHLVVLGGFLGAGKTSAILALSRWLGDQGIRMACIANDQGRDLADTAMLRGCGLAAMEITGGCFCCRFDALLDATDRLGRAVHPDVIVAEAVGSCTDLSATVASPMRRLAGDTMTVAPLSIVIDPVRARTVFGLDAGEALSEDVVYLYTRQIAEAELIVINKCDLLDASAINELATVLEARAPWAAIFRVSLRHGTGLDAWFHELLYGAPRPHPLLDIDYRRYAAGEACLGWLNATFAAVATEPLDGNALVARMMDETQRRLRERGAVIAHLKMTLASGDTLAAMQLVSTDGVAEISSAFDAPITQGEVAVNLRAEAEPALLEDVVRGLASTADYGMVPWRLDLRRLDAFRPSPPVPTHRDTP